MQTSSAKFAITGTVLGAVALICSVIALVVALSGGGHSIQADPPESGSSATADLSDDQLAVRQFCMNEVRMGLSTGGETAKFSDVVVKPGTGDVVLVTTGRVTRQIITGETLVSSFRCESTQIPDGDGLVTQVVSTKLVSRHR